MIILISLCWVIIIQMVVMDLEMKPITEKDIDTMEIWVLGLKI